MRSSSILRAAAARTGQFMTKTSAKAYEFGENQLAKDLILTFESVDANKTQKRWRRRSATEGFARHDVVDEKLCDDLIAYLAPTLEPYKGCTIIDVNPGACLWSSKLHDFLNPKCHILMEPEESYVPRFIQPLLDRPGSTYRHTPMAGASPRGYWHNYTKLFSEGDLMPPRPALQDDDPRLRKIDHNLLLTGNLARRSGQTFRSNNVDFASLIIQHMTWAALANDLIHAGGLVRQLWWTLELSRNGIYPANPGIPDALSAGVSLGADVTEAAGVRSDHSGVQITSGRLAPRLPTPALAAQDAKIGQSRMEIQGMRIPAGRTRLTAFPVGLQVSDTCRSPFDMDLHSLDDFDRAIIELETRVTRASSKRTTGRPPTNLAARVKREREAEKAYLPFRHPQCEQLLKSHIARTQAVKSGGHWQTEIIRLAMAAVLDWHMTLIGIEASFKDFEETSTARGEDIDELRKRLLALGETLNSAEQDYVKDKVWVLLDEQIAFWMPQQRGFYFNRKYEPLKIEPEDFWPQESLNLIDIVPSSRDLAVKGLASRKQVAAAAQDLMKYLFQKSSLSVPEALERLSPNAAQDLIPMLPSLTDPRKGGRLDPKNVRVRHMTDGMLEELFKAWFEWPFNPSSGQFLSATTPEAFGSTGDPKEAEFENEGDVDANIEG